MKKIVRILALTLVSAMMISLVACGKETEETKKKKKKKKTEKTTTEETTTEDTEPSESTEETTTTEETTETSAVSGNPDFQAPAAGCKIDFPTRDLYHYDMDLTLNEEDHTVGGHVVFQFYNDSEDDWEQLCMRDYSSLFVDAETAGYDGAIETNGALTEITNIKNETSGKDMKYTRDDDVSVIWLDLDTPLAPGEQMTLSYDFVATVPTVADRYGLENGVYNVTNFYPILAEYVDGDWSHAAFYNMGECFYSEVSDYNVRLTVPSGYVVASTGTEKTVDDNGDTQTYTYEAPCVRDFVFSASADFVLETSTFDGVCVNVLYNGTNPPASDMTPSVEKTFEAARDALAAFKEAFGEYPYPELDVILAPIDAGGMEYPNLIIITDIYCTKSYSYADYEILRECVAHEIGHQWFMGIVGSNSGMQPWQDESITSYTEFVYYEYIGDLDFVDGYSRNSFDLSDPTNAAQLQQIQYFPLNKSYYDFPDDDTYTSAVYMFGKAVLFQMEEILGREEFHAVLREYVHRNAFTNADPMSFFDVLYEYAGTDNAELNALIEAAFVI
ncbi:MAG: M1 family metallopeptidase [Clostridiales bacterium]|nr:M1 family metallopeptidase [Clostridiales bacterium]